MKYFTNNVITETVRYLKTVKNLPEFLDELDKLNSNLFIEKGEIYDTTFKGISYSFKSYIEKVLQITNSTAANLKEIIAELKTEAPNIHQVKFVLAFEPSESFIDILSLWVQSNLGENIILNYEVNTDIIGGVIIIYKGKYLDYSTVPLIDKYFEEHTVNVQKLLD